MMKPFLTNNGEKIILNISDTRQAIDLVVQLYLDHSSINRIKTTSKNQISSITSSSNVEQIQKKCFNF